MAVLSPSKVVNSPPEAAAVMPEARAERGVVEEEEEPPTPPPAAAAAVLSAMPRITLEMDRATGERVGAGDPVGMPAEVGDREEEAEEEGTDPCVGKVM